MLQNTEKDFLTYFIFYFAYREKAFTYDHNTKFFNRKCKICDVAIL